MLAEGDQLPLILPVEQIIVVLHGRERRPAVVAGSKLHIVELIPIHSRSAQRADLAGLDEVVQGLHRLLDGRIVIVAVDDVQIQIVGAEPPQRAVDLAMDGLAGEPPRVEIDLGRDDHFIAGDVLFERLAEVFLAGAHE